MKWPWITQRRRDRQWDAQYAATLNAIAWARVANEYPDVPELREIAAAAATRARARA